MSTLSSFRKLPNKGLLNSFSCKTYHYVAVLYNTEVSEGTAFEEYELVLSAQSLSAKDHGITKLLRLEGTF